MSFRQIVTAMVLDHVVADLPSSKLDLWERFDGWFAIVSDLPIDDHKEIAGRRRCQAQ